MGYGETFEAILSKIDHKTEKIRHPMSHESGSSYRKRDTAKI